MRPIRRFRFALAAVLVLSTLPAGAQRPGPKKAEPPSKARPPAAASDAPVQKPAPVAGLRGAQSASAENEAGEDDPAFDFTARLKRGRTVPTGATGLGATASSIVRLARHPKRTELARWLEDSIRDREIDVALLGGHKYMINDCLGVKASAGEFRMKLENPSVRFENTGIVLTLEIDHVAFSALKIRIRPNPNPLELCKFGRKFEVGGAMEDVRLTLRFDPFYDLERCRIGQWNDMNPEVRIGNLNLKPLQNDLDRMAKNMVEDALTVALQMVIDGALSGLGDLVLSSIDQFLEADCPTKAGEIARGAGRLGDALGSAAGGGKSASGGGSSSGARPGATNGAAGASTAGTSSATNADVPALLARIAELEARIRELESGAPAACDLEGLLAQLLERLTALDPAATGPAVDEMLVKLLALAFERSAGGDPRGFLEELARTFETSAAPNPRPAEPAGASAAPAPWVLVPNPELKGRMGRIVVRFPDAELGGNTYVALHRDGKKVADRYGDGAWELLPGMHEVQVTRASVPGCEVRTGHDTLIRTGMLALELGPETFFRLFAKGGELKLHDAYGSATIGLPIGEYEVEIQGQRELVSVREGEITRF